MNNITFGNDGPVMKGNWFNPKTGDSFTVRDTYFENNQLVVLTTDGRQLDYNFIQDYIQSEKPIQKNNITNNQDEIPAEVKALIGDDADILQEDLDIINNTQNMTGLGNLNTNTHINNPLPVQEVVQENVNYTIIEKALAEKSKPEITTGIDWSNMPFKEIDLLIDVLSISEDEIVDWYTKQLNSNIIMDAVKNSLKDKIHAYLNQTNITPVEEKPNKKTKTNKK